LALSVCKKEPLRQLWATFRTGSRPAALIVGRVFFRMLLALLLAEC